ncbi:tRNA 2-thiouridine(34) synthase MnmA, partial [Candidatus Nomurabacteria bacterium]|nr:tRNA 2-thiouridine(34) synthase MnmA [Candidatus Nomurabacteria bacterium]
MTSMQEKKTIFVGVSGGVDSSVAVALLKEQGHRIVGVFIRTWQPEWMECTWRDERRDAMRVCAHLDIPFLECDLTQEYKTGVADYMIGEYKAGRTPNPDVMCNKEVKFGGFLKWALERGADYVATGHYTRVVSCKLQGENKGGYALLRGVDESKDQSYFLWTLTQDQLQHILFPIGNMPKSKTRTLAKKYHLPTATKKDSQGICFIGEISMKEFLSHYIDQQLGDVLNAQGEVIGYHSGALFFTLGERHGFTITHK